MKPQKALKTWAKACDITGIPWYLYKETLLCANGYHSFPKELPYAQIVVLARDLPDLLEYVFPHLPRKWSYSKKDFISNKRELFFRVKNQIVLEISVLYAVEDESQMKKLAQTRKEITVKKRKNIRRLKLIDRIGRKVFRSLYKKTFGRLVKKSLRQNLNGAFQDLVEYAGNSNERLPYYCDCLTSKKPMLLDTDMFSGSPLTVACRFPTSVKEAPVPEIIEEVEDIEHAEDEPVSIPEEVIEVAAADADSTEENSEAEAVEENDALTEIEAEEEEPVFMEEEVLYPVFSGYREYLAAVYGDYENGLFDEIGCGLTVEEKEALKEHQSRCFQALSFLQELSKEFNLRYYLIAGSVLGAVRHGGFIPWDDDVDIGIRVEDIEEFEKVVKEQLPSRLPEGFALEQSGANNPYPRMFSKICFEGRCCIDLWPLVPTYREGWKAKYLWYFGKVITKIHYKKIGHSVNKYQKIVKLAGMFLTDKQVMAMARRNERKYADESTPAYINLYSIYTRHKETMRRAWLDDEATAMFNGLEVPVVGHTHLYLTHLYGKYMSFPAPWKRVSRHVARFSPKE